MIKPKKVRKRPLGKTGLVVSELAIGTWGLSGDAYGAVEDSDAERVVRRAIDMGFSLIDTADAYGGGRMEALVGRVLRTHRNLVVVTKAGIDRTTVPARKIFSKEHLVGAVERSCKRLGVDALPVFLLHHPSHRLLHEGDTVATVIDLKKSGKIRHWGVAAGDEDAARAAIDVGAEVVELAYNMSHPLDLHRISGDVMVEGCGVLARSVLAYGLLTDTWTKERIFANGDHRNDRWTRAELEKRLQQLDAMRFLVKDDVRTLRSAAVRFVLANHVVSAAVLGPRTVEQLEQLVRETGGGPRYLREEDMKQLFRALDRVGISS